MRWKIRRQMALAALAAALGLASCGGGDGNARGPGSGEEPTTEITAVDEASSDTSGDTTTTSGVVETPTSTSIPPEPTSTASSTTTPTSPASSVTSQVPATTLDAMLAEWRDLNDRCRGSDDPPACAARDALTEEMAETTAILFVERWMAGDRAGAMAYVIPEGAYRGRVEAVLDRQRPAGPPEDCRFEEYSGAYSCLVPIAGESWSAIISLDTVGLTMPWYVADVPPDA